MGSKQRPRSLLNRDPGPGQFRWRWVIPGGYALRKRHRRRLETHPLTRTPPPPNRVYRPLDHLLSRRAPHRRVPTRPAPQTAQISGSRRAAPLRKLAVRNRNDCAGRLGEKSNGPRRRVWRSRNAGTGRYGVPVSPGSVGVVVRWNLYEGTQSRRALSVLILNLPNWFSIRRSQSPRNGESWIS